MLSLALPQTLLGRPALLAPWDEVMGVDGVRV